MTTEHHRIVFLLDEKVYGYLINQGAYISKVRYEDNGVLYEVFVENDDFEIIEDIQIEIEEEE